MSSSVRNRRIIDRRVAIIPPSNPVIWLDASQLALSDTDPVSSWANLAQSENFTQATGSAQPTYRTNQLNGMPGVVFDGTADHLDGTISHTLKPVTLFAVVSFSSVSGLRNMIGPESANGALGWGNNGINHVLNEEGIGLIGTASTAVATGVNYQLDASFSGTGDFLFGRDGADDGSGTNNRTIAPDEVCVGARNSSSQFFAGTLYELIIWDQVLPSPTRNVIRQDLIAKWGL